MIKQLIGFISLVCFLPINGYGIRKSSEPYISGDSFRSLADHLFDETNKSLDPKKVQEGDIIFLKTDYLEEFFTHKHSKITSRYILITHNSDYGAPGRFKTFLDDEQLVMWFGQNPTLKDHPKFTPIPIGIANQYWHHGNVYTFDLARKACEKNGKKKYLLGMNFRPGTNETIRGPLYSLFSKKSYCQDISASDHAKYLDHISNTRFVLSPEGNGLDTHRTWEILLMGSIPIVEHSDLDSIFEGLPVLIIKNWHDITPEYLVHTYELMKECNSYNMRKITFNYWKDLIYGLKNLIKNS